jgi:GntR family transcriptional regulator, transcriptional repressor for pyruvate dehydrogenase complex
MNKVQFQPLRVRRLSEVIEESIRESIVLGQIEVGSKMPSESEISKQFGVSVVTVREALRGLEAFGIIERKRGKNGGTYVTSTKADTVISIMKSFLLTRKLSAEHLNQVRMIVEPAAVELAATQITETDLEYLSQNVEYCRNKIQKAKNSIKAKDFYDIEDRHTEFHRLIGDASHNPLLSLLVDYMSDFLAAYEKSNVAPDIKYSISSTEFHEKILNSLKEHNPSLAKRQMEQHVKLVGDYYNSLEKQKRG